MTPQQYLAANSQYLPMSPQDFKLSNDTANLNPATSLSPNSAFSNLASGTGLGFLHTFAGFGRALYGYTLAAGDYLQSKLSTSLNLPIDQQFSQTSLAQNGSKDLEDFYKWSESDPRDTGWVGPALGGTAGQLAVVGAGTLARVSSYAVPLLIGPTSGYNTAKDLESQGVDSATATNSGIAQGVIDSVGTYAPLYNVGNGLAQNFLTRAVKNAVTNEALGVSGNLATSHILKDNGYSEMAAQYAPLDAKALLANGVLGAAFTIFDHDLPPISQQVTRVARAVQARSQDARGTVGIPTSLAVSNLDAAKRAETIANVLAGGSPSVTAREAETLTNGTIPDPQKLALDEEYRNHTVDKFGTDFTDIPDTSQVGSNLPNVEEESPTASPHLDDATNQALNQLKSIDPGFEVDIPAGKTTLADMGGRLNEDYAQAEQDSKLYSVAVGCYLNIGAELDNG